MLSSVSTDGTIIVSDLEAGIGTLTRLPDDSVDVTLVVVEPTPRSIDVAQRAVLVAGERNQGVVKIVANKIVDSDDEARIRSAFDAQDVVLVPADPVVADADRRGMSPLDVKNDSPAAVAIVGLSNSLTERSL